MQKLRAEGNSLLPLLQSTSLNSIFKVSDPFPFSLRTQATSWLWIICELEVQIAMQMSTPRTLIKRKATKTLQEKRGIAGKEKRLPWVSCGVSRGNSRLGAEPSTTSLHSHNGALFKHLGDVLY